MKPVPGDCTLIPTQRGALLVSRSHGVYCAIFPNEIESIKQYIQASASDESQELSQDLTDRLEKHGFFDAPRPFQHESTLLQFQVTNACNLHCIYCAVKSGKARPNEITLEDVKRIIDEAIDIYPDIRLSFTGGEPLLVPWIFDAIDYAAQRSKYPIGLLSNLLLLKNNDDLFDKIVQFVHRGHQLRMSISAIDKEACNRLSGKDCYDDAIDIIKRLNKADALPHLDIPLSAPDSKANVKAYPQFRRSVPIDDKLLFAKMYIGGRENGKHVFNSTDDEEQMLDDLVFEGGTCIETLKTSPVTERKRGCLCNDDENLFIRSDGEVYTCFRLMGKLGHISEGIKTIVERRRNTPQITDVEPCCSCPFRYLCAAGCQTDRLIFQESHKEPFCGQWRKQLVAEMLFEDKPYFYDWPMRYLISEAQKRVLISSGALRDSTNSLNKSV